MSGAANEEGIAGSGAVEGDPRTEPKAADPLASAASHNAVAAWFEHQWTALRHGAAAVYHEVVAIEGDATKWTTDNPDVGALASAGLSMAESYLSRYAGALGIPVPALSLVGEDVLAALKAMAAADPTVQSGGPPAAPAEVHA